ncbi:class I adenylate-forming enzyme family protein [Streptomyces violaceusniger]
MNVAHLLVDGSRRAGGADALVFGGRRTSYPELVDRVARVAAGLRRLGLRPGDRVALLLPNRPELVEMLWACFWGGFVAVPLNWHLHPDEIAYVVEQSGAAAILVSAETSAAADMLPPQVRIIRATAAEGTNTSTAYSAVPAARPLDMAAVNDADPAWLFYTSGTTGRPKGATLSHRNLAAMTAAYHADIDPVAPGSSFLHAAPLTHGSGLYLLPAIGRGATNVISPSGNFSPGDYLGQIERHKITHAAFLAPTMLNRIVRNPQFAKYDLSGLRSIVVGGAPLYQEDLRAAVNAFGPIITQMYGQGEAPMTITAMPPGDALAHPGSCGRPFGGIDLRIVAQDGSPVPDGSDGEVIVRGAVVMNGYWKNPKATAPTLMDGWLHTGDIGHLDPDDGYLYLTDRAKDVIITGGSNVYPREVEEVLLTHPAVREVAVVGVPDSEWGESVVAFVVTDQTLGADELVELCKAHLASFKKPRSVVFVDDLPKNAAGKIIKRQLRQETHLADRQIIR